MKTCHINYMIIAVFIIQGFMGVSAQDNSIEVLKFNELSEMLLKKVKAGQDTKAIQDKLANTSQEALEKGLTTDHQKLAFWLNFYNANIQIILGKNPELYKDKRSFFNDDRIHIAGETISFAKIEHGIIRKSQWPLGLGKIRKWFPNTFERKLRVDERDYRIHFALNCGAKDCPPVAIYEADRLNEQLNKSTEMFLKKTTGFDAASKEVAITALFSWFRGDFGCKKEVRKILKNQGLIPTIKNIGITYKDYDWTLDLDNWITL